MSVILHTGSMSIQDGEGNRHTVDAISDMTTQQRINEINTAATNKKEEIIAEIVRKGAETNESIPDDYAALDERVSNIKKDLSKLDDTVKQMAKGEDSTEIISTTFVSGQLDSTTLSPFPSANTCYGYFSDASIGTDIYFDAEKVKIQRIEVDENNSVIGSTGWVTASPSKVGARGTKACYVNVRTIDDSTPNLDEIEKTVIIKNVVENKLATKTYVNDSISPLATKSYVDERTSGASVKSETDVKKDLDKWGLRHQFTGRFSRYELPSELGEIDKGFFTDGRTFITDFDVSSLRNVGGVTYYVSPNGSSDNDGLTEENPLNSIGTAHRKTGQNNTYILLDGVYTIENGLDTISQIYRTCNIVAKNSGKAILTNAYKHSFVLSNGIYKTTESNPVNKVIDFSRIANGITYELEKVTSLAECTSKENTYYIDGSNVYIHMIGDRVPTDANLCVSVTGSKSVINIVASSGNQIVYLEGLTIIGGYPCNLKGARASTNTLNIYAKNCKFLHAYTTMQTYTDAISLLGCTSIMQGCECAYAVKDGFNYHTAYSFKPIALEIDCIGHDNGFYDGWTEKGNNGSTMHDGGKIVRVNGVYYNNNGGNVADIADGTLVYNLGCVAFDSKADTKGASDADFVSQGGNNVIYCDNCKGFGSYLSFASSEGTMYIHNCDYENKNSRVEEV